MANSAFDILLVEDDNTQAVLVQDVAKKMGYTIERVATGEEALQKQKEARYNIFLLDYTLPDMTGLQIYRAIKKENKQAVIIMITGHGSEEKAVQFLKEGGDDYIAKAPNESHLYVLPHVIEEALDRKKVEQEKELLKREVSDKNQHLQRLNQNLKNQIEQLEALHQSKLERERGIQELKKEVNKLLKDMGRREKY